MSCSPRGGLNVSFSSQNHFSLRKKLKKAHQRSRKSFGDDTTIVRHPIADRFPGQRTEVLPSQFQSTQFPTPEGPIGSFPFSNVATLKPLKRSAVFEHFPPEAAEFPGQPN
jgi:hypothetical protein